MPAIFKFKDKYYQTMDLKKKCKKLKADNIEIIWEGEATQSELEKRFNDLTSFKKEKIIESVINTYKIYSDTIPPIYLKTLNDLNKLEEGKYCILILNGDTYIDYKHYEKTLAH